MDPFDISGVDVGKKIEQVKLGVYVTAVITYKTTLVVNGKPMTVSLALGEVVGCNTIFVWPSLQTENYLIMTENNTLVSGILGEQFGLEMMVPKISKEAPKTSEVLPVLLPVSIQGEKRT